MTQIGGFLSKTFPFNEAKIQVVVNLTSPKFLWNDVESLKPIWKDWTLPEPNSSHPENGWLEYDRLLLGQRTYFQVFLLLVSGRVIIWTKPALWLQICYPFHPDLFGDFRNRFWLTHIFSQGVGLTTNCSVCWGIPFGVFQWFCACEEVKPGHWILRGMWVNEDRETWWEQHGCYALTRERMVWCVHLWCFINSYLKRSTLQIYGLCI